MGEGGGTGPAADGSRWRVAPGAKVDLATIDTSSTAGAPGDREATKPHRHELRDELVRLQERLWAEQRQSLLVVLQAMDAGGKDGTIKKIFSGVNPQGCNVTAFKAPNDEELAHDFLWRCHKAAPRQGMI